MGRAVGLAPHDLSILDFVLPEGTVPIAVAAHTADPVGTGRACLAYLSIWMSLGVLAHVNVNWLSPTRSGPRCSAGPGARSSGTT